MANELIDQARNQYKNGNKNKAKELLIKASQDDPLNKAIWLGLFFCSDDPQQKKEYLECILQIDPEDKQANKLLANIESESTTTDKSSPTELSNNKNNLPQNFSGPTYLSSKMVQQKGAGKSTFSLAENSRNSGILIGLIGIMVVACLWLAISNGLKSGITDQTLLGLFILFLFVMFVVNNFTTRKSKEFRRATRGAMAEVQIGSLLSSLDDTYEVIHDVEYDFGNIDHVVISQNGSIFMIETKSHHGKVTIIDDSIIVNNKPSEKDFISQSLRNSYWLRDEISKITGTKPWVTPILVFTNAYVPYTHPVKGVVIINQKFLLKTITKQGSRSGFSSVIWEKNDQIVQKLLSYGK